LQFFQVFSQADVSTTRKYGGTGLGLVISNRILERMGSKIEFVSETGKGSNFFFTLEMEYEDAAKQISKEIFNIENVLVVDDNKNNRTILVHFLNHWNIKTEEASNGFEAIKIISSNKKFDLIIVDFNMPSMNGIETIKQINKEYKFKKDKRPEIILYSSVSEAAGVFEMSELKITKKLVKPVKSTQLYNVISEISSNEGTDSGFPKEKIKDYKGTHLINIKASLLIAEDIELNMELAKSILEQLMPFVKVTEAKNGDEAVEKYRTGNYNLILMDIQMPDKDGYTATKEIRKLEKGTGKHTPIIALTAGAVKGEREKCINAGMDDYLSKPIVLKSLKEKLEYYLTDKKEYISEESKPIIEESVHFNRDELLDRIEGNQKLYNELINVSINQFDKLLSEIVSAAIQKDYAGVKTAAHSIKGAAAGMCFNNLMSLAKKTEISCSVERENLSGLISEIKNEWGILRGLLLK